MDSRVKEVDFRVDEVDFRVDKTSGASAHPRAPSPRTSPLFAFPRVPSAFPPVPSAFPRPDQISLASRSSPLFSDRHPGQPGQRGRPTMVGLPARVVVCLGLLRSAHHSSPARSRCPALLSPSPERTSRRPRTHAPWPGDSLGASSDGSPSVPPRIPPQQVRATPSSTPPFSRFFFPSSRFFSRHIAMPPGRPRKAGSRPRSRSYATRPRSFASRRRRTGGTVRRIRSDVASRLPARTTFEPVGFSPAGRCFGGLFSCRRSFRDARQGAARSSRAHDRDAPEVCSHVKKPRRAPPGRTHRSMPRHTAGSAGGPIRGFPAICTVSLRARSRRLARRRSARPPLELDVNFVWVVCRSIRAGPGPPSTPPGRHLRPDSPTIAEVSGIRL